MKDVVLLAVSFSLLMKGIASLLRLSNDKVRRVHVVRGVAPSAPFLQSCR
jgi:hypothetical protein